MGERSGGGGRFSIIPARAYDDTRFVDYDLRVLGVLGTYADRDGWCWPSRNEIARRTRMDRAHVRRHIHRLAEFGYIHIQPRSSDTEGHKANRYRILHDHFLEAEFDATLGPVEAPPLGPVGTPPGASTGLSYILEERPNKIKSKRATQFPSDLTLDEKHREVAHKAGIPESEVLWQWTQFQDYHLARASAFADWSAAWRTWVRNAIKFAAQNKRPEPTRQRTTSTWTPEEVAAWQKEYRELSRQHRAKRS